MWFNLSIIMVSPRAVLSGPKRVSMYATPIIASSHTAASHFSPSSLLFFLSVFVCACLATIHRFKWNRGPMRQPRAGTARTATSRRCRKPKHVFFPRSLSFVELAKIFVDRQTLVLGLAFVNQLSLKSPCREVSNELAGVVLIQHDQIQHPARRQQAIDARQ